MTVPTGKTVVVPGVSARGAAVGAVAIGSFALGALAVGAVAIGSLAVARLRIRKANVRSLELGDVTVDRLIVRQLVGPHDLPRGSGQRVELAHGSRLDDANAEKAGSVLTD